MAAANAKTSHLVNWLELERGFIFTKYINYIIR